MVHLASSPYPEILNLKVGKSIVKHCFRVKKKNNNILWLPAYNLLCTIGKITICPGHGSFDMAASLSYTRLDIKVRYWVPEF